MTVIDAIFPGEEWANFISLMMWALTFLCIFIVTLVNMYRNKRAFDGLSAALTSKTFLLFVLMLTGALAIFWPWIRPGWVRWTIRTIGILINFAVIAKSVQVTFPDGRLIRWTERRRFLQWANSKAPWGQP